MTSPGDSNERIVISEDDLNDTVSAPRAAPPPPLPPLEPAQAPPPPPPAPSPLPPLQEPASHVAVPPPAGAPTAPQEPPPLIRNNGAPAPQPAQPGAHLPRVDQHAPPSQGTASASPGTITIKIPVGVAKLGHNPLVVAAVSGAVGGLLGGALKSVIENNWDFLQTNNQTNGYLLFGFLGIFAAVPIGLVVASWNSWRAGSRKIQPDARRAAVFAAVGGYVGFAIGAYVFSQLTNTGNDPYNGLHYYIGRMLAFSIIGAAVGAALAASYGLKSRRVLNGLIGGAVGGAVSGLALQFVSAVLWNPMPKWVFDIAYVLPVGIGIAVGTVVVERVLRSSWVRITAGPMSGKEFTLFKPETRIGSDYRCDIVMARDPGVRPFHAAFLRDGTGKVTVAPFEGAQLNINGMPSEGGELRNLDAVVIGGSVLTYQEKAVAQ